MDYNLLDDKSHARKALSVRFVGPNGVFIDFVHSINEAYQIIHRGFRASAAHLRKESNDLKQGYQSIR